MRFPYKTFIEENFMIDAAKDAKLVPFVFNEVQAMYYEDLVREYDIERKGINVPIRENILKARREGFSSLILGLFAADDLTNDNPTQTDVLSYTAGATATFRSRYRTYLLTFFLREQGYTLEQIQQNIGLLEEIAPHVLASDGMEIEVRHNGAKFQCNTASARVGGRGGVRHKILFSENAFYPDTPKLKAGEMIAATSQQVDPDAGWIFLESTENGGGTYQAKLWNLSKAGKSTFRNRFYGAGKFYTPERLATIKAGYVDLEDFRRDYPMTEDDLFKGSAKSFTSESALMAMVGAKANKELLHFIDIFGENYIDQCETLKTELELLEKVHSSHALYVGIDSAKIKDATVATVLKDRRRDLSGGVKVIAVDTTSGDFIADWFERNTNWYVLKVKFSRPSKSLMFTNLMSVIAKQLTALPPMKEGDEWVSDEAMRFMGQMLGLEKEKKGNMMVVAHPKGECDRDHHEYDECPYHDDYPDSWTLAEFAYTDIHGVPKQEKKPEVPTVPNSVDRLLDRGRSARRRFSTGSLE